MSVLHPANMANPLHPCLAQDRCQANEAHYLKETTVGNSVMPFDVQDLSKTAKVKNVQFLFLTLICGPCLRGIE